MRSTNYAKNLSNTNMNKNCFQTIPYREGFIHINYNPKTREEEIKITCGCFTFPCKTLHGAKRKITKLSKIKLLFAK